MRRAVIYLVFGLLTTGWAWQSRPGRLDDA